MIKPFIIAVGGHLLGCLFVAFLLINDGKPKDQVIRSIAFYAGGGILVGLYMLFLS